MLPVAQIMSVFVQPANRGGGNAGAAARLVQKSCDWARTEFGAVWVVLDVRNENTRAIAFYQRLGFADSGIRLPCDADPAGDPHAPGLAEIRMVKRL